MKKFFLVMPQSANEKLFECEYEAVDNSALAYGKTRFPAIPLVNAHIENGDRIKVVALVYDIPACRSNIELLEAELDRVCEAKDASYEIEQVLVPFDNGITSILGIYQELIRRMAPDDELYADITFGSKPMPIVLTMALQYAYRTQGNSSIECVTYGQISHHDETKAAAIYDVTALVQLDEIVRLLADARVNDSAAIIENLIGDQEA